MRPHLRRALALPGLLTLGLAGAGGTGGPPPVDAFALYDAAAGLLRTHYAGPRMGEVDRLLTQERADLVRRCGGQARCPEGQGRAAVNGVLAALGDGHTQLLWNVALHPDPSPSPLDPRLRPTLRWEGKVAVVGLPEWFEVGMGAAFREAVGQAAARGATGLVVDLRDNPGGVLDECLAAAQVLAGDRVGLIGVGRSGAAIYNWRTTPQAQAARAWPRWNGPLALLVSPDTASCGELLAYWGQQAGGTVVGLPTRGLLNTLARDFALPGPSVLRLTAARATPDGQVPLPGRVQPDLRAGPEVADILAGRDPVLEAALEALRR
ncbi:carboxyl-terminal processing protease [Deinococcus sp. HSC-46F16]|uniref:S41 family peptidase n=1 Tax=Deinococcus sp. HSC-46F16 TaxID=2910968 RepID=UPI0020A0139F|nr:S41 family peptidase [Deinococcus sp. HSC-46F16]MCP2014828.1 carboxyl-terminal processing protease [Deinococcus sp. HSC-46F16]